MNQGSWNVKSCIYFQKQPSEQAVKPEQKRKPEEFEEAEIIVYLALKLHIGCVRPSTVEGHGQKFPEVDFANGALAQLLRVKYCQAGVLLATVRNQASNPPAQRRSHIHMT